MPDAVLKQLGKYELTGVFGQGAMGVVYRAFDPVLNRFLAIKVMSAAIATDGALRERFLREARAAGSLQHPNVITIFDFGEVDGHLFIAMEFIDGVDLGEIMQHPETVPIKRRLDIVIDALNGLAYAHSRGLVHRDIKPANIRVTTDHRAKIMDFGIARVESSELTQTGVMLGTPQYMSPEQVMGGNVTPASDVFSMGAVLYEFLSGIKPFHGETLHAVLFNVVSENPRPMREVMPGLPPTIDAVLAKALAKEPDDRYQDAVSMAKDLAAVRLELTGSGDTDTVALAERAQELRSHAATSLRDPQLQSFIKRESAQNPIPARSRRRRWIVPGSITGAAALVTIWFVMRSPAAAPTGPAGTPATAPSSTASMNPAPPATESPGASAPTSAPAPAAGKSNAQVGGSTGATTGGAPSTPAAPRSGRAPLPTPGAAAGSASADSALKALFSSATRARQRAQDAGAAPPALAPGDSLMRTAQALAGRGRGTEAAAQLSMASERWGEAERNATRATASAPPAAPAAPPAGRGADSGTGAPDRQRTSPSSTPLTPPATNPSVAAAPETVQPPADPRREIESAIAAYERAIESGDVNQIRRAYPGLTDEQQQGWENFFKSVHNFKATLTMEQVAVTGNTASAAIGAVYAYDNRTTGRADRQQLRQQAMLTRDTGGWRITSIR